MELFLRQLEDEELARFGRADWIGVMELAIAIKGVGDQGGPVRQRDGQVGACQNHIVAARRAAEAVEDQIGSHQVEGAKLRFRAADQQAEIRAAVVGLPAYGEGKPETGKAAGERAIR